MKNVCQCLCIDDIQMYLANGARLHPTVHSALLDHLQTLHAKGRVSLLPSAMFEIYHHKLAKRRVA